MQASSNKSNCTYLAERCEALRPVLVAVREHWMNVESAISNEKGENAAPNTAELSSSLHNALPLFQLLVAQFERAVQLIEQYGSIGTVRKFFKADSIKTEFLTIDAALTKVIQDLTFGLTADANKQNAEIIATLQNSLPYLEVRSSTQHTQPPAAHLTLAHTHITHHSSSLCLIFSLLYVVSPLSSLLCVCCSGEG